MKTGLLFLFFFLLSAEVTFILTQPKGQSTVVKPLSVSEFSMEDAPRDSLNGRITSFNGDVQWQSRVATEPAQLKRKRIILQGESIQTKDTGNVTFEFNNTASITLLANTEVAIIQSLPANLLLQQKTGDATYTKLGKISVSMQVSNLLINQEEGKLNISIDPDLSYVTVKVKEGSAKAAYTNSENVSTVVAVTAGNAFVFDLASLTGSVEPITQ
jgi:hypothetical protein